MTLAGLWILLFFHEISHYVAMKSFNKTPVKIQVGSGPGLNLSKIKLCIIPMSGFVLMLEKFNELKKHEAFIIFSAGPISTVLISLIFILTSGQDVNYQWFLLIGFMDPPTGFMLAGILGLFSALSDLVPRTFTDGFQQNYTDGAYIFASVNVFVDSKVMPIYYYSVISFVTLFITGIFSFYQAFFN